MNDYYIYGYYESEDKDPFYIGKGRRYRMNMHLCPIYLEKDIPMSNKIKELKEKGIEPIIQIISEGLTEKEAYCLEKELIFEYGRMDLETGCLLNKSEGGEKGFKKPNSKNRKHSEETKRKIGLANIGNTVNLGREQTIEHRTNISISHIGKKHSKETIEKIKKTKREYANPICSFDLLTKEIISVYPYLESSKKEGYDPSTISRVLNGYVKHHKYLGWRHLSSEEITLFQKELESK